MNAETSLSSLSFWCSNPFSSSTAPLDAAYRSLGLHILFLYLGSSLGISLKNGPKNVSIVGAQIHRNDSNPFFAFYSFSWRNDGRKKMQRSFSSIYLSFLLALTQFLATLHTNWQIEYWSDAAFSFSTLQNLSRGVLPENLRGGRTLLSTSDAMRQLCNSVAWHTLA